MNLMFNIKRSILCTSSWTLQSMGMSNCPQSKEASSLPVSFSSKHEMSYLFPFSLGPFWDPGMGSESRSLAHWNPDPYSFSLLLGLVWHFSSVFHNSIFNHAFLIQVIFLKTGLSIHKFFTVCLLRKSLHYSITFPIFFIKLEMYSARRGLHFIIRNQE